VDVGIFYQSEQKDACLLKLVSLAQWEASKLPIDEQQCARAHGFEGKLGELVYLHDAKGGMRTVLIGTGQEELEQAVASVVQKIPAGSYFTEQKLSDRAILLWSLAQYRFDRYKKHTVLPRRLCIKKETKSRIMKEAGAIFLVRDLINTPTQDMGPEALAAAAKQISQAFGAEFEVIQGKALESGYPAIHAVGRAAKQTPRLICMTWGKSTDPRVTLVGKGVCFDSGGLNIKNASGMRIMKKDMGGAANALGLAQLIMDEALSVRLQVLIPAVENAIGPDAYRPGDILRMRNKLTVEIENTDAEGRLVMADALSKACEENPALLIDFSTLTGAARIAVGTDISALFSNDDDLATALLAASQETFDPIWRLPLYAPYLSLLDSSVADVMNAGSTSYAGAITAALFLQKFVTAGVSWAHFDMMAWNPSNKPGRPEGGEAMAIRAVAQFLRKWCKEA
jgi:leucyl aminopeptidase